MRAALTAGIVMAGACAAFGQTKESAPAFEVASVKVSDPSFGEGRGNRQDQISISPGGVTMMNTRLKSIIQWAFHLQNIQVTGPGWIESSHFDIVAKAPGLADEDHLRAMVQSLLAQRFKLAYHKETKEMTAYVMTVGKNGHKMTPSQGEGEMSVQPGPSRMVAHFTHVTAARLAEMTQSPLQGVVVDQTGLKGEWDFTLDASTFAGTPPSSMEEAIGMVIQAVYDQLGIKIDQKKTQAEVLVVEHAEKVPVEN